MAASMASPAILLCLLLLPTLILAKKTYIVQMKHQDKPESFATPHDWYSASLQSLSSTSDSILYSYNSAFHGFAAYLDEAEVESLRESESVLGVYEETVYTLHTTRTPQFLGIDSQFGLWEGHGKQDLEQASKDVIIGVLDTGIWPESKSFDDTGMPEIPKKWRGVCESASDFSPKKWRGVCESASDAGDPEEMVWRGVCESASDGVVCVNPHLIPLIGARSFAKGLHMAAWV